MMEQRLQRKMTNAGIASQCSKTSETLQDFKVLQEPDGKLA